ncbi:MAG TPA: hypothetical protein DEQ64_21575 [Lachnoclostridium sp.]|jgi:hypothetical protein|uniref:DUF6096 family protein n=1 Tax=Lacrimispora sp. TaxID=2719234 RepID=UPI000EC9E41C|nr:DUF6096 family protein [Lacrimispora sp.]HCD46260.1 hypothetical protein [Lachnoclostridium sp.]
MNYGLDDEKELTEEKKEESTKTKRAPFAYWNVGGREYKLKLTTAVICQLEDKFKCNLLNILSNSGGVPPLAVMLTITQGAMKSWEHGIKYVDIQAMFDKYCEEGGTQLSFMADVLMPIYSVSGFFSEDQQTEMDRKLEEVKEVM